MLICLNCRYRWALLVVPQWSWFRFKILELRPSLMRWALPVVLWSAVFSCNSGFVHFWPLTSSIGAFLVVCVYCVEFIAFCLYFALTISTLLFSQRVKLFFNFVTNIGFWIILPLIMLVTCYLLNTCYQKNLPQRINHNLMRQLLHLNFIICAVFNDCY